MSFSLQQQPSLATCHLQSAAQAESQHQGPWLCPLPSSRPEAAPSPPPTGGPAPPHSQSSFSLPEAFTSLDVLVLTFSLSGPLEEDSAVLPSSILPLSSFVFKAHLLILHFSGLLTSTAQALEGESYASSQRAYDQTNGRCLAWENLEEVGKVSSNAWKEPHKRKTCSLYSRMWL